MKRDDPKFKQLEKDLHALSNSIVRDPDELQKFVERWSAGFKQYSFYNTMLIYLQKRDATLCAGFNDWHKHGRWVNKGEHGLAIYAPAIKKIKAEDSATGEEEKTIPYFLIVYVFDYSQTDGAPLELANHDMVKGISKLTLDKIIEMFDIPVQLENPQLADGHTAGDDISLSESNNELSKIATYFHELAHIKLGHTNHTNGQDNRPRHSSRYYLGNWSHGEDLGDAGQRALKCAEKIVRELDKHIAN